MCCRLGVEAYEKKMIGFGSDGASVMLGKNNGVAALLKKSQPSLQAVHCAAHRLDLAFNDTFKKEPLHNRLDTVMTGLYLFYKQSNLNRSMLERTFDALAVRKLMPTRFGGTRWIAHTSRALENVIGGYEIITTHLSQVIIFQVTQTYQTYCNY